MADIRQTGPQSGRDLQKQNAVPFDPETASAADWYKQLRQRSYNSYLCNSVCGRHRDLRAHRLLYGGQAFRHLQRRFILVSNEQIFCFSPRGQDNAGGADNDDCRLYPYDWRRQQRPECV